VTNLNVWNVMVPILTPTKKVVALARAKSCPVLKVLDSMQAPSQHLQHVIPPLVQMTNSVMAPIHAHPRNCLVMQGLASIYLVTMPMTIFA
jgi:hypothetical protein